MGDRFQRGVSIVSADPYHFLAGTKHDWRVRVGDYRIIYEIADVIRVARIQRIRHRREVYR